MVRRSYIQIDGRWHYVYVLNVYDQLNILGETVQMVRFTKNKSAREILEADISRFFRERPKPQKKDRQTWS